MRHSLNRRVGTEGYFSSDRPEIMGTAILVRPVGKTRVFVRPPEGIRTKARFYRVWSEMSENLKVIGRLYPDGKFCPLKTVRAEETMRTGGWGTALRELQRAVLVHRVMTE